MLIADISVVPIGEGTSVSGFVKHAQAAIKASGVTIHTGPMSTSFEAKDIDQLLSVVKAAHEAVVNAGAKRVVTQLKIDDRRDKDASMIAKMKAIE